MKYRLYNRIPITAVCFRLFYGNLAHRLEQSYKTGVSNYYAATIIVKACPPSPAQRSRRSDVAQCNKDIVCDISNTFYLCFVDRESRYNLVRKNQLDAKLIFSIFRQPVHVSGISRRYNHMYTTIGTYCSF